jgi:hypothetical protein
MSELNVICKICANLALFGDTRTFLSYYKVSQTRAHRWNSKDCILSQACPRSVTLTQCRLIVKANHLVFQVKNATTVCYTKHIGGYKPKGKSLWCDVYERVYPHR